MRVLGSELRVGDTLDCLGGPDTITGFRPYISPLAHLFPAGARVATFARRAHGETIDNGARYDVIVRMAQVEGR